MSDQRESSTRGGGNQSQLRHGGSGKHESTSHRVAPASKHQQRFGVRGMAAAAQTQRRKRGSERRNVKASKDNGGGMASSAGGNGGVSAGGGVAWRNGGER